MWQSRLWRVDFRKTQAMWQVDRDELTVCRVDHVTSWPCDELTVSHSWKCGLRNVESNLRNWNCRKLLRNDGLRNFGIATSMTFLWKCINSSVYSHEMLTAYTSKNHNIDIAKLPKFKENCLKFPKLYTKSLTAVRKYTTHLKITTFTKPNRQSNIKIMKNRQCCI